MKKRLNCHEKQINGTEGTVFKKPKIFFSITERDEQADRNITSLYPVFLDQDEPLIRNYGKPEASNTLLIKWKTIYYRF